MTRLVLSEQRISLEALLTRRARPPTTPSQDTRRERALLLDLALRILAEAVAIAEADCGRILMAAHQQASELVRDAREDTERLLTFMDVDAPTTAPAATVPAAPTDSTDLPPQPQARSAPLRLAPGVMTECPPTEDQHGDGHAFWDGFDLSDGDRWAFLEEDALVGAHPVRRLLRLPIPRPRTPSVPGPAPA